MFFFFESSTNISNGDGSPTLTLSDLSSDITTLKVVMALSDSSVLDLSLIVCNKNLIASMCWNNSTCLMMPDLDS
jgi:hypothetical protein